MGEREEMPAGACPLAGTLPCRSHHPPPCAYKEQVYTASQPASPSVLNPASIQPPCSSVVGSSTAQGQPAASETEGKRQSQPGKRHKAQHIKAQQQHAMSGRWAAAPFTPAQYEELEHQALIYKYLLAGVPVPQELLLPIRRGFVYHQPALGHGPYFGKKVDLEPGRCRRTDGKKWRCSKEAAPDSKYCERHMHRGRNRSRKPVEPQLVAAPLSQPPAPANLTGGFHNHTLYPAIAGSDAGRGGGATGTFGLESTAQLHMDNAAPYATAAGGGSKDLRYSTYGMRTLAAERSQLISGGMDSLIDNSWRLLPSQTSTFQVSSYPVYGTLSGLDESTICSLPKTQREPFPFFGSDFGNSGKQDNQTLRPFFDEWPKPRDSWSELADDNSLSSFPATQLSISTPMGTCD